MKKYILPIRVYYEDTDIGGVVYHPNYLKFFERGRTESLRALGFELNSLLKNDGAEFVVFSAEIHFLQPAYLDQLLYVETEITEVRSASIRYNQLIHANTEEGPILCKANIRLACLNNRKHPRKLPELLLEEIKK